MAIKNYTENGQEFWEVYVNLRCKSDSSIRLQKRILRLKTESEARKEEKKLIREFSAKLQDTVNLGKTWRDIVHLWSVDLKSGFLGNITHGSVESYISIIHKWTCSWMNYPAADITRAEARTLILQMEQANASKAYQRKVKSIISKVYNWGIEYKHILNVNYSPFKGIIVDSKDEKVPDILTLEEIKRFLLAAKAVANPWYPVWTFAILTGMRSGELHALSWDQIDLEKNTLLVDRSYDSNLKRIGPTKGRYWRIVPINTELRKMILDLKTGPNCLNSSFVLPRFNEWDYGDQALPLKNFLRSIKVKPVKFHALKACFATQMLASGVSAPIVMKIGGWKKSSTMDIYLRLAGIDTQGATECLNFTPESVTEGENVINLFQRRS